MLLKIVGCLIRPSASWAIDSEPIRARGIIVNYPLKLLLAASYNYCKKDHIDLINLNETTIN